MAWSPLLLSLLLTTSSSPRFENSRPLPHLPGVMLDAQGNGVGFAAQAARRERVQGRVLWIDCTANIDRYNTPEKIEALLDQVASVGFNTIVFDIKPISGQVVYPSKYAPKLKEWRGRRLPTEFDPVGPMVEGARRRGLNVVAGLNAFSEGHQMFQVGPGYLTPDRQTVLYEPTNVLRVGLEKFPLAAALNTMAEGRIGVFTASDRLPAGPLFALTLDRFGQVQDGFELNNTPGFRPTLPRSGTLLVGQGAAADFLRKLDPGNVAVFDTEANYVNIGQRPANQIPLMMNPHHPDVRAYALNIVREIVTNYAFDGVIYDDRLRYGNLYADFSDLTRAQFEAKVGAKLNWPDDVFRATVTNRLVRGIRPGRYFDAWISWRASVLKDFLTQARSTIEGARPGTQLACYAGSWYGDYMGFGSNWASPQARSGFWYVSPRYSDAGFAPLLDFLITGCYYPTPTIYQAMESGISIGETIEAGGMLTNRLVRDETWSYAGIMLSQFAGDPRGLGDALQAATGSTQGVMVFDLSHDIEPMWPVFRQAFQARVKAPHQVPGLLRRVRAERLRADARGAKDPPILMPLGATGTGH